MTNPRVLAAAEAIAQADHGFVPPWGTVPHGQYIEMARTALAAADAAALAGAGELAQRCKDVGMKTTGRAGDLLLQAAVALTAQAARIQELEAALRIAAAASTVGSEFAATDARAALGKPA